MVKPQDNYDYTTNSGFERSIQSIPAGVREVLAVMKDRCKEAISPDELRKIKNVVVTGCGDSLCAAYASQAAFEQFTDLRVDVPYCLELSRHYDPRRFGQEGETLVLIISTSGLVSRCEEAARRAKKYGAVTCAVTANSESAFAQVCDHVLDVSLTEFWAARTPGSRNYVGSALSLQMLAAEIGVIRGSLSEDERDAFYAEIDRYNAEWEKMIPALYNRFLPLSQEWKDIPYFEAISSGAEFAAAWFTQAKAFESLNIFARYENFEDWCHVDYFLRKMDSGVFLYCAKNNPAISRCHEAESILDRQNYRYIVVTDDDPTSYKRPEKVLTIPTSRYVFLHAVFEGVVGCVMFDCLQRIKGNGYYCSDMIDSYFPFGGSILRNSEIVAVD